MTNFRFFKTAGRPGRAAVQVTPDGVALAAVAPAALAAPATAPAGDLEVDLEAALDAAVAAVAPGDLLCCRFLPAHGEDERAAVLRRAVAEAGLKGMSASLVLAVEDYQVSMLDRPDVSDAELREAVRWSLQDDLPFPVAEAAVDCFPMPTEVTRGQDRVVAVAAHRPTLAARVALLEAAGLQVDVVDVAELALRNLVEAAAAEVDGQNVALLYLSAQGTGMTTLERSGVPLFSRRLEQVTSADGLVLQAQRSLDYCESQLRQAAPALLLAALPAEGAEEFLAELREMLPVPVVDLGEQAAQVLGDLQVGERERCLPALGAALRQTAAAAAAEAA